MKYQQSKTHTTGEGLEMNTWFAVAKCENRVNRSYLRFGAYVNASTLVDAKIQALKIFQKKLQMFIIERVIRVIGRKFSYSFKFKITKIIDENTNLEPESTESIVRNPHEKKYKRFSESVKAYNNKTFGEGRAE